jgi:uncharacterized protein (TIGR02217 family)
MSVSIFPILYGEGWPTKRNPHFSTIVSHSASGKEVRIPNYPYPLPEIEVPINVADLTKGEIQELVGFYEARIGAYDSFLYWDPSDYDTQVNAANTSLTPVFGKNVIGTGDGGTKTFQFFRSWLGGLRPIFAIDGITATYKPETPAVSVYVNGAVVSSGWSMSTAGLLTFTSAPANGYAVAVDCSYFYTVRFSEDSLATEQFVQNLFSASSVKLQVVYF